MGSVSGQPLFSFGVIADVQYADIPDGHSFLGVPRYYRHSMLVLQRAVQKWNQQGNLKFVLNFGDIVDGFCPKDQSLDAVKKVVEEFDKFEGPVHHMIGNHCLYNLPRDKLLPLLRIPDHPKTLAAMKILDEKNPNVEKNSPNGLVGLERRFLKFNGAVGTKQLQWLDGVLEDATKMNQKVVVCCHLPLDPGTTSPAALLWNYDEVMNVIHRYDCVKVCLSGHDHKGGYSVDCRGIHHRCLEAALECPPGSNAFGSIDVYENRLSLVGTDRMKSTEMHSQN